MSALHLRIHGRVQGVGFREAMRQEAGRIGITGWARNRADGTVEAIIAGEEPALADMLAWCHKGPLLARVDQIEHSITAQQFSEFTIRE